MTSLEILAPATLTVLGGSPFLSSLANLPPGGISVANAAAGTITVQITAASTTAVLSASNASGALVSSNAGRAITITGTALEVNAALASFEDNEPVSATRDTLSLTASEPGLLPAQTDIAVDIIPNTGPAFVAPPQLVTLQPNALDQLGFLDLSDPIAAGLAQIGLGQQDSLILTLAVSSGLLFLPGYGALSPISAAGLGTGEIFLNFTADDIGALNALLSGLEFIGPAVSGGEHLSYALRNLTGVLPNARTYGNVYLNIAGANGAGGTLAAGSQTLIEGNATLANNLLTGTTSVQGNLTAPDGLVLTPGAALELPGNYLFLGGTSLDFGTLDALGLAVSGQLAITDGASFSGPLQAQANAFVDFAGQLTAGGGDLANNLQAVALGAGAVLSGGGTLEAGNFLDSGMITGPGTLIAASGETLLVAAGSVGGGAELAVAPGGVMVLGPVNPLYGIFNTTPLVIDSSVELNFLGDAGAVPIAGPFAGTLGGAGGAFVINAPQVFAGTVTGFAPGDALIFPGLSDFGPYDETGSSFYIGGFDGALNEPVTYVIAASIPLGDTMVNALDAQGDAEISLRPMAPTITQAMVFEATAGIAQPLIGLNMAFQPATTESLRLTISAAHGMLRDGTLGPAGKITLTGANIAAINQSLAALSYTGSGIADTLSITSTSGELANLANYFPLNNAFPGAVNAYSEPGFSEAQTAVFPAGYVLPFGQPLTAGQLLEEGTTDFSDAIMAAGISGSALIVDSGGVAVFDPSANVQLGADATIGDANGAGTLAIVTDNFTSTGNLTLTADPDAAGSVLDVLGSLRLAGALHVGAQSTGLFDLGGSVSAAVLNIDPAGSLFAYGTAAGSFGVINDDGAATLAGAAQITAGSLFGEGVLDLGGTASLNVAGLLELAPGTAADIGIDNTVSAGILWLTGGALTVAGTLDVAGSINFGGALVLAGGTVTTPDLFGSGTVSGYGDINGGSLPSQNGGLPSDYAVVAQGGELVLGGSVAANVAPTIMSDAVMDMTQAFVGSAVRFSGAGAELVLDQLAAFGPGMVNFTATDAIDLVGVGLNLVTYTTGTGQIHVYNSLGSQISVFGIQPAPFQPAVGIVSDGFGGSLITLGDELPCFARGTGLLTPHGYRAVESLKPGDPLITAAGASRPVRWIGRRTLDLGPATARFARPVLILPGAFGPGLPARPLRLSPLHCVFAEGVLVPVTHLVNGATIMRETMSAAMTYFHIELDRHDILLAEGLPCESYFDSGNRGALYHEQGRRSPARKPCAPSITKGPRLARLRRRLHQIALDAGFSLTYWPVLRAFGGGADAVARVQKSGNRRLARFAFDQPVRDITLLSATACPADTDPDSEDRRELGICLDEPRRAHLGEGFYPRDPGDDGIWMGRQASLHLHTAAKRFTLPVAAIVQSWVRPP